MPAVTINSLSYAGTVHDLDTVRRAPVEARPVWLPITTVLIGRDGTRNVMYYGYKLRFELTWDQPAPQATRNAIAALLGLGATFPYIHIDGVTYPAVQLESESDYSEEVALTMPDGTRYYNLSLVLHQP